MRGPVFYAALLITQVVPSSTTDPPGQELTNDDGTLVVVLKGADSRQVKVVDADAHSEIVYALANYVSLNKGTNNFLLSKLHPTSAVTIGDKVQSTGFFDNLASDRVNWIATSGFEGSAFCTTFEFVTSTALGNLNLLAYACGPPGERRAQSHPSSVVPQCQVLGRGGARQV